MTNTSKLAHFKATRREGDITKASNQTGYSISHISNVLAGRRTANEEIVNTLYKLSYRRKKS